MSSQVDGSTALRTLIREASDFGIKYAQIAHQSPAWSKWTEAAIKKLVTRSGNIRPSRRVTALRDTVISLLAKLDLPQNEMDELHILANRVDELSVKFSQPSENEIDHFSDFIGQCFHDNRRKHATHSVPSRFAFVRYDYENKRLIKIIVDVRKGSTGQVFSMKLTGRQRNRRIIVGDVLGFLGLTTFSGLAFNVTRSLTDDEFHELDIFDFKQFETCIDKSPLGNEKFDIPSVYVHSSIVASNFIGLDGGGNPISGLGLKIEESLMGQLGIDEDAFSSVECAQDNKKLLRIMELVKAKTIPPNYHVDLLSEI